MCHFRLALTATTTKNTNVIQFLEQTAKEPLSLNKERKIRHFLYNGRKYGQL
jgi:hypothetical protein